MIYLMCWLINDKLITASIVAWEITPERLFEVIIVLDERISEQTLQ